VEEHELRMLLKALHFAADKHKDQRRKDADASPYINHPIAVAQTLLEVGHVTDVATLCAAVLHDTVEDTETRPEELLATFGPVVAGIVAEVTDDRRLSAWERKRAQVTHARHLSTAAKLVKLGDKICNVTDVLESPPASGSESRKADYVDWATEVIDQVRGTNRHLEARFDALAARLAAPASGSGTRTTRK
jgi:GTP diphosphokinase / guanosine-3',5'-bis(diphosphate) 3'-diphosphatase